MLELITVVSKPQPWFVFSPHHEPRVPHISLVFREMWDTTDSIASVEGIRAAPRSSPGGNSRSVTSHISRKTSEMWGTQRSWRVEILTARA